MKYIKITIYILFVFSFCVSCANKGTVPDINGIWIIDKELTRQYLEGIDVANFIESGAHGILNKSENVPDVSLHRGDSYFVAKIISGKWMTRVFFENGEYYTVTFRIERISEEELRNITSLKGLKYYAFEIMAYDKKNNQYLSRQDLFPQKRDDGRVGGVVPRSRILLFDKFNDKNIVAVYHLFHDNYDYVDKFWFVEIWIPLDTHEEFILHKLSIEKRESAMRRNGQAEDH